MLVAEAVDKQPLMPPAHESAIKHVTGRSNYIDDISSSEQLYGAIYYSPHASAKIRSYKLDQALKVEGICAILSHMDIPGTNDMGPIEHDEPILAEGEVSFIGQAVFLIAARTTRALKECLARIEVDYDVREPVVTLNDAFKRNTLMHPPRFITRGDVSSALNEAENLIRGGLTTGAQEHWYLETQICLAVPGEDGEMMIYSSTQNPTETQSLVANALNLSNTAITVEVRRMGGAFGGKETQAGHVAVWAALLAHHCGAAVKLKLSRNDDQRITGKRHPFQIDYRVGFDGRGCISAAEIELDVNAGATTDLTMSVMERAMMHCDNGYYIPNIKITGRAWKTNLPSNTAFRGFGAPQGIAAIESIVDSVARFLNLDSAVVRQRNFYGTNERNVTPYGQTVENNRLPMIFEQIMASSDYAARRKQIIEFNRNNEFKKKGMALVPVKFGISFTTSFLNQAGALVNIYKDGSVAVNHGGTEMGQGLHTKIRIIAALELGIDPCGIIVGPTNTGKVPNTSPTAASSSSDLNGMAVKNAIEKLKGRIGRIVIAGFNEGQPSPRSKKENLVFKNDMIYDSANPDRRCSFREAVGKSYLNQISLSATGYYKTPSLQFNRESGKGRPYHYMAFGISVTEVILDTLTCDFEICRADILHDVGDTLNARLDKGQIEGAYIQSVGWCTIEECKWDSTGRLQNDSPDTYKIPSTCELPVVFNVSLLEGVPNHGNIRKSKAVGEPPFIHGLSCWLAIKDAISAIADHRIDPLLPIPASKDRITSSIQDIKRKSQSRREHLSDDFRDSLTV